ncbi:MAG: molybdopterin molybdotransferase MoeA [Gammaproteobacteria bacterium]|nr:molybdopterin molybdotransferase MoeA [Gammaproteobacteria bacterium]
MTIKTQTSCADDYDPESLSVEEALHTIKANSTTIEGFQQLALKDALDRILAEDLVSSINVPGHDNSAMDGYAIRFNDLGSNDNTSFKVIDTALAGHPAEKSIGHRESIRIMTGAVMPEGSDTVVMQEHVLKDGDTITIANNQHREAQNVRRAGEDIAAGDTILKRGRKLNAADIGLAASLGIAQLKVYRRLKVCFFSTGDELRPVGSTLAEGEIYDSNRYTLYTMLKRLNVEVTDLGIVGDQPEALKAAFETASLEHDVIITSGGVSVGEADYSKSVFEAVGEINFWKIAMKPGRPLAFGTIGDKLYFGLPGNPVSVMTTFYIFVQPALKKMAGENEQMPLEIKATALNDLRKRPGRTEFQRGILSIADNGDLHVSSTGAQGSGILSSVSKANCFIVLAEDTSKVSAGDTVTVIPFVGLV